MSVSGYAALLAEAFDRGRQHGQAGVAPAEPHNPAYMDGYRDGQRLAQSR